MDLKNRKMKNHPPIYSQKQSMNYLTNITIHLAL